MSAIASTIVIATDSAHGFHNAPPTSMGVLAEAPSQGRVFARLLTVGEVATILRVHPNRVYELAARRTLPVVRVGRLLRFNLGVLQQWIESGGTQTAEVPYSARGTACRE